MEGNLLNHPLIERKTNVSECDQPVLEKHAVVNPNSTNACNDDLKCGFLYEIDHKMLPPKCPIQLKSIRVAMIAEKNEYNVIVRFPSSKALDVYFSSQNEMTARKYPDLDEQFTMGLRLGKEVLIRQILPPEFQEQGRFQCFWLVSIDQSVPLKMGEPDLFDESGYKDVQVQELESCYKSDGFLTWGVRRKITFMGRCKERMGMSSGLLKDEDDDDVDKSSDDESGEGSLKRRRRSSTYLKNKNKFKSKLVKYEEKKTCSKIVKRKKLQLSYGRWSKERYKNAEVKMLEIMKEKEAVHGKPVLRPVLRLEARKHIGDTGLLDHLLKHMAGKVAPNGEDRFQRRHNADGAMVYWLESAELVDLRKQAGVNDPFWIPPPGWKPGDSLTEEPTSAREIKLLQEEISMIRRDVQELITWKRSEDNGDKAIVPFTKSISENSFLDNRGALVSTMKDYENLLKRKAELEQELSHVSGTIEKLKEDRNKKKRNSDMAEEREESVSLAKQGTIESDKMTVDEEGVKGREEEESRAASKAAMRERLRSGFRICKPQGTFLWPSMAAAAAGCSTSVGNNNSTTGSNVLSPHQVLVQQVDGCSHSPAMVPTPPSVSSATASPPPLLLLFPPTQAAGSGYTNSRRLF